MCLNLNGEKHRDQRRTICYCAWVERQPVKIPGVVNLLAGVHLQEQVQFVRATPMVQGWVPNGCGLLAFCA